jgi:hypothetical protein
MRAMPEFANIVILVGIFVTVFLVSNVTARVRGYRE